MSENEKSVKNEVLLCLKNLLSKLNVRNCTITLSSGNTVKQNFLGTISTATVKGESKKGKKVVYNFVIKSAPRNEVFREAIPVSVAYDREIYVYETVLHEFEILQKEKKVHEPFKSFPKYYDSMMDNITESIIMEDMKELGYQLHDRTKPLNFNHALLVIKGYAKFHALSFGLRINKPKLFEKCVQNIEENFFNADGTELNKSLYQQTKIALLTIDPVKEKSLYQKLQRFQNNMTEFVPSLLKSDLTDPYSVICHGDCWTNNFLFKYKSSVDNQNPLAMCMLDWQLARYGSPVLDLSYFIFACTDKKMRDQHYEDLITEYYNTFSSFLKELGGNPQTQYSFEMFQKHLKKYSVFGLYMSILLLAVLTCENDELPDIHNIVKVEHFKDTFIIKTKNEKAYKNGLEGVILDFERLGYDYLCM